jgi:hypothetical protein
MREVVPEFMRGKLLNFEISLLNSTGVYAWKTAGFSRLFHTKN